MSAPDAIALSAGGDGASRMGGPPLLPAGATWPLAPDGRALAFIAALDLGELPRLAPLPAGGTLLVFWDLAIHELEKLDFAAATRVLLVAPGGALEERGAAEFGPLALRGELSAAPVEHQLLGRSRDIQGPVLKEVAMWLEGSFPETRARYGEAELRGEGWTLLGQFASVDGVMFGDAGALYLVVPEADLRAARFDRVMGIMQC
jgi:hypothetical protein